MLPEALDLVAGGNLAGAESMFAAAERLGRRFQDPDLTSLASQGRGRVLVGLGRDRGGNRALRRSDGRGDRRRVEAVCRRGRLLQRDFRVRRAARRPARAGVDRRPDGWCASQPHLVPYRGECLAHRAEILRLHGQWPEALDEAERACRGPGRRPGVSRVARRSTRSPSCTGFAGWPPKRKRPIGWRASAGDRRIPAWRCCVSRRVSPTRRARRSRARWPSRSWGRQRADVLMAGAIEILLACDDAPEARRVADELKTIAAAIDCRWLRAVSSQADGAVRLAEGDARVGARLAPRGAGRSGVSSTRPTRRRASTVLVAAACRRSAMPTARGWSWDAAVRVFRRARRRARPGRASRPRRQPPPAVPGGLTSAGGGGAAARRARQDQPHHRRRARRSAKRPSPATEQHLHQAGSVEPSRGHGLRLHASARRVTGDSA